MKDDIIIYLFILIFFVVDIFGNLYLVIYVMLVVVRICCVEWWLGVFMIIVFVFLFKKCF